MGNADQSGAGQLFDQELHHLVLAFRVKCRSRFVKHDDFWIVQEQSREREPLLFAARQRLVPGRFLILDFVFQVRQPDLVERFLDLFGGPVIGRPGVCGRSSQGTGRHVRPLRKHEQPSVGMDVDTTTSPWP